MLDLVSQVESGFPARRDTVRLWIKLLGDFEANLENGHSVLPVSKKARALLALIAAQMPQPLRREFAAGLLWSGKPRDHAANSFRQALRELQIALAACGQPPLLQTGNGRLSFAAETLWVDIHEPGSIKWKPEAEGAMGPLLLCQNLQGLDPAFDAHLERLWKNLVFQQAFVPVTKDVEQHYRDLHMPPTIQSPAIPSPTIPSRASPEVPPGITRTTVILPESTDLARLPIRTDEPGPGQGWRIAVLPFRSLGAPVDSGLSLSLAEEISAAMARFRMPRLTATGSFWDGDGPVVDALARARAYNLDYVISGTIQSSGTRVRVTVTLLDVSMEFEVIWACRFEGTTNDLFTLQDTIASHTVAQVDPELLQRHQFRGEAVRTPNSAAHQLVLTAIQGIYRPDRTRFMRARDLLLKAIEQDPDYAAAHAWLAYWYIIGVGQGWNDEPAEAGRLAGRAAERAVVLDPLDARGVTIAGHVKAYLLHDIDAALALHQRAIALNPNLQLIWAMSSVTHTYNGNHRLGVEHANIGIALSPSDPHVFFIEQSAMMAHFFLKELQTAELFSSSVLERKPGHAAGLRVRLAILGHLGNQSAARICLEQLRKVDQHVTIQAIISRPPLREIDRAYYAEGLRLAGVPDDID